MADKDTMLIFNCINNKDEKWRMDNSVMFVYKVTNKPKFIKWFYYKQRCYISVTFGVSQVCHGTLTALIMLVSPDPGIQPVTTITMSPDLKNPLAFPGVKGGKKQRWCVSKTVFYVYIHKCSPLGLFHNLSCYNYRFKCICWGFM